LTRSGDRTENDTESTLAGLTFFALPGETLSGGDEKEPDAGAGQGMASPYPPADGAGHGASDGIYEG